MTEIDIKEILEAMPDEMSNTQVMAVIATIIHSYDLDHMFPEIMVGAGEALFDIHRNPEKREMH
tara:strand:+ start:153 stop:344 length:192 start_codon:yes stop_codon:yes gene_type:complete